MPGAEVSERLATLIIAGYEREEKLSYRYLVNRNPWYDYTIHDSYESAIKYIKQKHPNLILKEEKSQDKNIGGCEMTYVTFPIEGLEYPYMIMKLKSM